MEENNKSEKSNMCYKNLIINFTLSSRAYWQCVQSPFGGISVFVSLFSYNKFEDLNEFMLSEMKLKSICIIKHTLFSITGIIQSKNVEETTS
jgi:hypothetical protein